MTRRYLRLLCWMLVGTLLYGQMAIAAYACPRPASLAAMDVAAASAPVGDNADQPGSTDPDSQKLCAEHCNYGHQSDQAPNLSFPAPVLASLYVAPPMPLPAVSSQPAADLSALVEASPPLAILHCCFRI